MEKERAYEIYTDASFDYKTKLATYAIVIIQEKKIIKAFAKKCKIQLENSTECEVFAIFQAINLIENSLINKKAVNKYWLRTDCIEAKAFIQKQKGKLFRQNLELYNTILETYKRVSKKMVEKDYSFRLKWIPRGANKVAHKCSYSAFKKLRDKEYKDNILVSERKKLLQFLQKFNSKQFKVLIYLYIIANEKKLIFKTQIEVAKSLEISYSSINRIFKELKSLNMLEKSNNGEYHLLL